MGNELVQGLAAYVRQAALAAGYEIDRPRGGAKLRLATQAGMHPSALSRLLSGDRMPDPKHFQGLARALRVPVSEFLVEAGIVARESLLLPPPSHRVTPEEVADAWGIHDEPGRELVRIMFERLATHRSDNHQSREDTA